MKKLIDPPVQVFLLAGTIGLLAAAGWGLYSLKMQGGNQSGSAGAINVRIPDSSVLDTPDLNAYPQMVETPLFWEARKAVEPAKVVATPQPVVAPVDVSLPEGRLIGIIDLGDSLFGIMQNATGNSVHLRQNDMWGAWKVTGIDPDRLILKLGKQEQVIPLVGDFSAPQENPQVAKARQVREQQAVQARRPPPAQNPPQQQAVPPVGNALQNAGLPFPADTSKQPPALSVKDALEARQRLMAARWGGLGGNTEEAQNTAQPNNPVGQAQ